MSLSSRNGSALTASYQHAFAFPFEQGIPDDTVTQWLIDYWPHTITVSAVYLTLVYCVQRLMRSRKPFELRRPLILWNGVLAIFSILGAIRTSEEFFYTLLNRGFYTSICYSMDTTSVNAHWYLFFAMSKFVELGDTFFLVLRKRPLSFLHCYHHCSVLVYTINAGAEHLAAGRVYMFLNFVAHSFMYTYYWAMSRGIKVDRSVAKFVTFIQLSQMWCGIGVSASVFVYQHILHYPCKQSLTNLFLTGVLYVSYCALFLNFWIQAYRSPKKEKAKKVE
ncbi:Elongation of very long chain fatty acids protein [Aphelenchoides besseyi]|nr:Elongation of very long chain fatty acids protein [Aphelenchoides besseyi]KAI6199912.1 Elongation of very long chain fatty acids protein [Aphelenchoides besseyi]